MRDFDLLIRAFSLLAGGYILGLGTFLVARRVALRIYIGFHGKMFRRFWGMKARLGEWRRRALRAEQSEREITKYASEIERRLDVLRKANQIMSPYMPADLPNVDVRPIEALDVRNIRLVGSTFGPGYKPTGETALAALNFNRQIQQNGKPPTPRPPASQQVWTTSGKRVHGECHLNDEGESGGVA